MAWRPAYGPAGASHSLWPMPAGMTPAITGAFSPGERPAQLGRPPGATHRVRAAIAEPMVEGLTPVGGIGFTGTSAAVASGTSVPVSVHPASGSSATVAAAGAAGSTAAIRGGSDPAAGATPATSSQVFEVGREINSVSLSPDGRRAVVGLQDYSMQIWDLDTGLAVRVLKGHKCWVTCVAYSLDSVRVASASADKTVKVWNSLSGQCESTLQGHFLSVASVAFSDDATHLASGSWDKTVVIWDVEQARALVTLAGHTDWVHSVVWAAGGKQLASASSDNSVRVWNAVAGTIDFVLSGHLQTVTSVSMSRNSQYLASGSLDCTVRVWSFADGALAVCLHQDSGTASVHCVAFTPDSERVVAGCSDKTVKVWSIRTCEQEARFVGHEDAVLGVCVTPEGLRAVSCSHDKSLRVWSLPHGTLARVPALATQPIVTDSVVRTWPATGSAALRNGAHSVAGSFKDLHDRLRNTEDTNFKLRRQLSEAQTEIEEKNLRMRHRESSMGEQERQLSNYRQMISNLTAEKERLERSFDEIRRELRQVPSSPAGCGGGAGAAASGGSVAASSPAGSVLASRLGPAGARRSVADLGQHSALQIHHAAGSPGGRSSEASASIAGAMQRQRAFARSPSPLPTVPALPAEPIVGGYTPALLSLGPAGGQRSGVPAPWAGSPGPYGPPAWVGAS